MNEDVRLALLDLAEKLKNLRCCDYGKGGGMSYKDDGCLCEHCEIRLSASTLCDVLDR